MHPYQIGSAFFFSVLFLSFHSGFCLELLYAAYVGREDYLEISQSEEDYTDFRISSQNPSGYNVNIKNSHGNIGGVYCVIYLLKYPLASSLLLLFFC